MLMLVKCTAERVVLLELLSLGWMDVVGSCSYSYIWVGWVIYCIAFPLPEMLVYSDEC